MLCLCRTLLAVVAVSCTLSRIQANGQSPQRLDRIKDLMCVLLLGGIQKEDLDANVLNKLQRYNVNIHDLNNNDLLQKCTIFQNVNNKNITPQTHSIEIKNKLENFIHKREDPKTDNYYNVTHGQEYDNLNKNAFVKENNNKRVIQYIDGQPELQSVLKFWHDIKINNSIRITETPIELIAANKIINENIRPEQKNKRNVPDASNSNESNAIQTLLLNFLMKNKIKNTDEVVTEKGIDLDSDVYFADTQKENTGINKNNKADISSSNIEAMQMEQYSLNNIPRRNKIHLEISDRDPEREKSRPINTNNLNDILNTLQSLKTYYPISSKDNSVNDLNRNNKESITSSNNLLFNNIFERNNIFTTEKVTIPKIAEQKLSQNVIKEIAKSVKELVLRDLRKEIYETTNYPTTTKLLQKMSITTKRGEITSTIKRGNQNSEQSILNKFMDLFEEIKKLNHKTLIISSEIRKENSIKDQSIYPLLPPPMFNDMEQLSFYKTKQYGNTNSQKIFDYSPQIHKFRSNVVSESGLQVPIKSTLPITVQTNNIEIPPLGIPVDNSENPINQNIIVPTIKTYRISEYNLDNSRIKLSDARIGEENIPQQSELRVIKSQKPHYYANHQNDKRFSLNKEFSNYDTNFNDKVAFNRYKESGHGGDVIKHPDIPRFHEKLEREVDYDIPQKEYADGVNCCNERYAYSKQMVECCNSKIASRQQMSLSNVKKQPSYDDTHFKNFLKSQQKVTDMLERILASRSRVRSVETA